MRKFLVILDNTTECLNAMRFAALRAAHTGGGVVILAIIPPEEFNHWIGVANIMREEARERFEEEGITPELEIREGKPETEIVDFIQDNPDIGVLVLGAGTGKDGPGPLVTYFLRNSGTMPIPITIVPGAMSKQALFSVA